MSVAVSARSVPLCDLRAQHDNIRDELRAAIDEVVDGQAYIMGPQVAELERQVAKYSGAQHAIGVSSGSDALLLSLLALDVGPGHEVITTPFTFFATVGAIVRLGARPVFVDVDPISYNLNPHAIQAAITPRTKAIIPVHLFGQTADMDPVLKVAKERGVAVVEDAAQAIGARYKGRMAGAMADVGCYSFFPSKNLGGMGDGGMVVTSDAKLADKMRMLRTHGAKKKYFHALVGGNFRLDTMQAAVLLVKLRYLDEWNDARRQNAARYVEMITGAGLDGMELPREMPGCHHVYNQFIVRSTRRDRVLEVFKQRQIGSAVYYPWPMHLQECFKNLGHKEGDFPEAERACRETCALPMFPELAVEQQEAVVQALGEVFGSFA